MKKFSRCALILILVTVIGAVGGYFYADNVLTPVYASETVLYVVVEESSEASLRSKDGGLNDDFETVIKGASVIQEAQRTAGTSESIDKYLRVETPPDSNIIKIICTNPDAHTAKTYVDAVAKAAVNTLGNTIPVKSVRVLSEGTVGSRTYRPEQYTYTAAIAGLAATACLVIEILVLLCMSAFKKKEDNSDDESEYERRYGNVLYLPAGENFPKSTRRNDDLSNDDDEIVIERDDADDKPASSKFGRAAKSGAKKNVPNEKQRTNEVKQPETERKIEPASKPEVKKPAMAKEEPTVAENVLFEENVIEEPAISRPSVNEPVISNRSVSEPTFSEAAASLEKPQPPYSAAKDTANVSAYGTVSGAVGTPTYGMANGAASERPYRAVKEPASAPSYGAMSGTAGASAYGTANGAVGAPPYGAEKEPSMSAPSYGAVKEPVSTPPYGAMGGTASTPAYGAVNGAASGQPPYGAVKEPAGAPSYGAMSGTANEPLYSAANDTASESAYSSMRDTASNPLYGAMRDTVNEPSYNAMKGTADSSSYNSYGYMQEDMFMGAINEAEALKAEPVAEKMPERTAIDPVTEKVPERMAVNPVIGKIAEEPKAEPVIERMTEEPKAEPVIEAIAEEPEDLPVMDAVLQAQQSVSSKYVYKDEDEKVPSTAKVSSKYLYRGDESYKKPDLEPVEKKQPRSGYSADIGIDDISGNSAKEKKKSRIIGIIRK